MYRLFLGFITVIGLGLQSCAQSGPSTALSADDTQILVNSPEPHASSMTAKAETSLQTPETYWITTYGSPVFDENGKVIRSIRLQPTVTLYETNGSLGRISADKNEWVELSILSKERPEGRLSGPDNYNDLPHIKLPMDK